jgi:hypothetical protein
MDYDALFSRNADFSGITPLKRMNMPKIGQHTVIEVREERNGKYFNIYLQNVSMRLTAGSNFIFIIMILCNFSASSYTTEALHWARETKNILRQSSFPILRGVSPQG